MADSQVGTAEGGKEEEGAGRLPGAAILGIIGMFLVYGGFAAPAFGADADLAFHLMIGGIGYLVVAIFLMLREKDTIL